MFIDALLLILSMVLLYIGAELALNSSENWIEVRFVTFGRWYASCRDGNILTRVFVSHIASASGNSQMAV